MKKNYVKPALNAGWFTQMQQIAQFGDTLDAFTGIKEGETFLNITSYLALSSGTPVSD